MKYILTQKEMDGLVDVAELDRRTLALTKARTLILQLSGFTCIHDVDGDDEARCDYCPCDSSICLLPRTYSK